MGERKKRNKNRKLKKHSFRITDKHLTSCAGLVPPCTASGINWAGKLGLTTNLVL